MCSLGTVLWLMLEPAGHLCSLIGVTVEINLCPTCHIFALPSFAGQNSAATSISPSSLLSQKIKKSMLFLEHKSDSFHSGIVLKL